jgi:D-beta-D-heptose 7-phosphate kinase/D-beta-D-heptose 1-phosphate adenosyltransferase
MILDLPKPNIIVVGDIMLDHNIYGNISKIANEAPIPVLHQDNETYSLGGCGHVLNNLYELGCNKLYLFSRIGVDRYSETITDLISKMVNVESYIINSDKYLTTVKHRGFCEDKIIFRYDTENTEGLLYDDEIKLIRQFETLVSNNTIDSIIFSDYNKGVLTERLCQEFIKIANKYNIFTCVDPKTTYTKYIGCSLIKPNRNEIFKLFSIVPDLSDLEYTHAFIKDKVKCGVSLITLADKGMSLFTENNTLIDVSTKCSSVIDVTGAGDIVNSIIGYFYKHIQDKKAVLEMATWIATKSVQYPGTYTIKKEDILQFRTILQKNKLISIKDIPYIDRPIIFTNGCFDILHPAHISLFEYCRSLSKSDGCVIVGLNSDSSIKDIKGKTRPINDVATRVKLLSVLEYIDYIIVFDELTPLTLIKELLPNVLVKGGDYTIDTIIGKEYCKSVKIFNYIPDNSTTQIIDKIIKSSR